MTRTYGSNYDRSLEVREIAARIRSDLKRITPKAAKVSVRLERFAGGAAIDVRVTAWPGEVFNPAYADWLERGQMGSRPAVYSARLAEFLAAAEVVRESYNHDGSDVLTDYYDVLYYGTTSVESQVERQAVGTPSA